jgi:catechol 2,3-dioxygenase
VHLAVSNLDRSVAFYERSLGFKTRERTDDDAHLGAGGDDILVLEEEPAARQVRGTTGLYHFAVLVPSRLELARVLTQLSSTKAPLQGFADHLVSEAIYLADPDGNGIELYRDRPRDEWPRDNSGNLRMASDPLDIDSILAELQGQPDAWAGLDAGTTLGHMHLHVANIARSIAFYNGVLGFDLVMRYGPSAAFLSAGGYHHHIGITTWAGEGAPPAPDYAVGLRWFDIRLPNAGALDSTLRRVRDAGHAVEELPSGFFVRDPSQNGIMLAASAV